MATIIHSNGSKWHGQEPDTIDQLIAVLGEWQLDRDRFDGFITDIGEGWKRFFGNFKRLSHVFRIDTNEPEVIERLTKAIEANYGLSYDAVKHFAVAKVRDDHPMRGVWHNRHNGTWERVREGQPGTFAANRAGKRMGDVPWIPEGVFLDNEKMQAVANIGMVATL